MLGCRLIGVRGWRYGHANIAGGSGVLTVGSYKTAVELWLRSEHRGPWAVARWESSDVRSSADPASSNNMLRSTILRDLLGLHLVFVADDCLPDELFQPMVFRVAWPENLSLCLTIASPPEPDVPIKMSSA